MSELLNIQEELENLTREMGDFKSLFQTIMTKQRSLSNENDYLKKELEKHQLGYEMKSRKIAILELVQLRQIIMELTNIEPQILAHFNLSLEKLGVKPYNISNEIFDPIYQEAIIEVTENTELHGKVIRKIRDGFYLWGQLLSETSVFVKEQVLVYGGKVK